LPDGVVWGGEAAAAIRTRHLEPETCSLYVTELPKNLITKHRLRSDDAGRWEFRKRFWGFSHRFDDERLAPPLLIYADLLAIGESRTLETARVLYADEIAGSLEMF
jgi:hypothetical protein